MEVEFPHADSRRLRSLCHDVKHEAEAGTPPRSSRALFRELREILEQTESLAAEGATDGLDPAAAATPGDELR